MKSAQKFAFLSLMMTLCSYSIVAQVKNLAADEYMRLLVETKNEYLLDVRTPEEFKQEHLNNAVNLNVNSTSFSADLDKLDKQRPVFIYCLSGGRSGEAMEQLKQKGFGTVYNLEGGILQWKARNFPLNTTTPASMAASSWKGMSKAEYRKLTEESDIPVLVDFKAVWCGPCKMLKPELDALQEEYQGKIKIIEIDVDQHKSLADDMQIRSIPLLIYYKNGKVAMNIEGYADRENLKRSLKLK